MTKKRIKGIKYIGSFKDYSGYGNAARRNLLSIEDYGIPITAENVSFEPKVNLINQEQLTRIDNLVNKKIDYNVVITHLTPEFYPKFKEEGKFNIGHTVWETSRLHPSWVEPCNKMDAIFVPCLWNIDVFKNSGVKSILKIFPHSFDVNKFDNLQEAEITKLHHNKLKFYSIFQWSERKNPISMLREYFSQFKAEDDVILILKSYMGRETSKDVQWLIDEINIIRDSVNTSNYPKFSLITDLMPEEEVNKLHVGCDVYLAPVRGEGFGIPIFDAALAGNPVIATGYGAQLDFLNPNIHSLLSYQLTPVTNMAWVKWYLSDQYWAEPNMIEFGMEMRKMYNAWRSRKGEKFNKLVADCQHYSTKLKTGYCNDSVIQILLERIEEVLSGNK